MLEVAIVVELRASGLWEVPSSVCGRCNVGQGSRGRRADGQSDPRCPGV